MYDVGVKAKTIYLMYVLIKLNCFLIFLQDHTFLTYLHNFYYNKLIQNDTANAADSNKPKSGLVFDSDVFIWNHIPN